jgi:hypothetical protein
MRADWRAFVDMRASASHCAGACGYSNARTHTRARSHCVHAVVRAHCARDSTRVELVDRVLGRYDAGAERGGGYVGDVV